MKLKLSYKCIPSQRGCLIHIILLIFYKNLGNFHNHFFIISRYDGMSHAIEHVTGLFPIQIDEF